MSHLQTCAYFPKKQYEFHCDQPLMKTTLLGDKYLYSSICDSFRGIFLKINIWNFKPIAYKPCHFGFDCPTTKENKVPSLQHRRFL